MREMLIFGAGGLGSIVRCILDQSRTWRPVAFLDSDPGKQGREFAGLPIVGDLQCASNLLRSGVRGAIVAIGCNRSRERIAEHLRGLGFEMISAIHPAASIARSARLAGHVVLGARSVICVHAAIGANTVISTGAIVEHDCVVGDSAFVESAARLAGGVLVGARARIGIGACAIPNRCIGADATILPGSVVIRNVAARTMVGGAPAREISPSDGGPMAENHAPANATPFSVNA